MIKMETNGLKFHRQLKECFEEAWFSTETIPTSTMFDNFTNSDNLRAWEVFNGESMIGLRWALNVSGYYTVATNTLDSDMFSTFETRKLYKTYPINDTLAMKLLLNKINDTKVIIFGMHIDTGDISYGWIDLENKVLNTGTGLASLKQTLGNYYAGRLLEYLQPNQ